MEDERPLPANVQRLIDQHEALGSHRALAQSLGAMATARSAEGAEGHAVICRRAARFVRVMAMQVTRFLAQPDLRLCHPTVEGDLQVTACTVNDNGLVQVMCMGSDDMPGPALPLHELVRRRTHCGYVPGGWPDHGPHGGAGRNRPADQNRQNARTGRTDRALWAGLQRRPGGVNARGGGRTGAAHMARRNNCAR
jgi:hypothetical protein